MDPESEFTAIYETFAPKIHRLCLGYASGDEEMAREWLQETFIKVWNHRKSFQGQSAFSTWIYRIAVNVCLNDLRRVKRHLPLVDADLADTSGYSKTAERENQLRKMYDCINQLSEQNKAMILMELEDIPQATIAETLGMAHGAVRTRLSRIRKALLKCMTNEQ